MKKKPAESDYLYATARIRAVEAADSLSEKNEKMLNASSFSEAVSIFSGSGSSEGINSGSYQELLDKELVKCYDLVSSMIGDDSITHIFKYPYDCNNLKLAFKGEMCGCDCSELYYTFGTVPASDVNRALRDRNFEDFPAKMAKAAFELTETLAKNPDPQLVDIELDRACLEDMAGTAQEFGCEYLSDIIKTKIDSYNLLSYIRCVRMNKNSVFYRRLTANGGRIDKSDLISAYAGELPALADRLKISEYSEISEIIYKNIAEPAKGFFSDVEKKLENLFTSRTDETKFMSYGPEIPIGYIVNCEKDIKNAGIILAGKSAGLDAESIRERLRI